MLMILDIVPGTFQNIFVVRTNSDPVRVNGKAVDLAAGWSEILFRWRARAPKFF
jgi:hypothetical protein